MRPSFANHDDAKKDLLPVIKEGSGAPKGACHPCPRLRRQVCANSRHLSAPRLRTHNSFLPRLRGRVREGARPPFGAHACGTRHWLSPRWLSPRTGFPEDGLRECFARVRALLAPRAEHPNTQARARGDVMFGCSDVYHWMGRAACPTRHLGSGVGVASLPSSILPIPTLGNGRLFQGFDFGDGFPRFVSYWCRRERKGSHSAAGRA